MGFLYRSRLLPLENLCLEWQVVPCREAPAPPARQDVAARRWVTISARRREQPMLDLIMLAIGLGFFALSIGYTHVCDRL
jgi:hypothetical protein